MCIEELGLWVLGAAPVLGGGRKGLGAFIFCLPVWAAPGGKAQFGCQSAGLRSARAPSYPLPGRGGPMRFISPPLLLRRWGDDPLESVHIDPAAVREGAPSGVRVQTRVGELWPSPATAQFPVY